MFGKEYRRKTSKNALDWWNMEVYVGQVIKGQKYELPKYSSVPPGVTVPGHQLRPRRQLLPLLFRFVRFLFSVTTSAGSEK